MGDLVAFLLARIGEDESLARQASNDAAATREIADSAVTLHSARRAYVHFNRWGPTRVLAECEAKRRIVAGHSWCPQCTQGLADESDQCWVLETLALPYGDHPDFDPGWLSGFLIKDGDE